MADTTQKLSMILKGIANQAPFSDLDSEAIRALFSNSQFSEWAVGETIIRPDEIYENILLITSGTIRLIAIDPIDNQPITLKKCGPGQLIGWASLLRAESCEWVLAAENCTTVSMSAKYFLQSFFQSQKFKDYFNSITSIHEAHRVAIAAIESLPKRPKNWQENIPNIISTAKIFVFQPGIPFQMPDFNSSCNYFLSTGNLSDSLVGQQIHEGDILPAVPGFNLPYRALALDLNPPVINDASALIYTPRDQMRLTSLEELGIVEESRLEDTQRYPFVAGKGQIREVLAVIEMICLQQNVPFRRDAIEKILVAYIKRDKTTSIELIGRLSELVGLSSQISEVSTKFLSSIDFPAVIMLSGGPVVIHAANTKELIVGDPTDKLKRIPISDCSHELGELVSFITPKRISTTPTSRFGWHWFTPLIIKYRVALILVFVASLLAQLFGLAIPLLIQQIIDKSLSQGNVTSLNVLGTVMVVLALFQGILTALRTYIFVDTTDRMDLTLGSAVIDRLLSLPLSFFEKRPVGELSQRIGELNTIRAFLTGTALTSVLSIIFALLYLIVMLIYSPFLTAVALSTFPIYLFIVFVVAPIYKHLIRKRAIAQARTQSHLIEVLGGIQTVKAQNFELTARWKWQEKYREFVDKGFRSVALGATAGELGKFLNQLSSLLVIWVGIGMVIRGEFTLGMLIAFRIISGNVTGPLLQLAGLYQGFQGVQLAMERLSDIVDQNSEQSSFNNTSQIALPSIKGDIRFENVSFRFGKSGNYQVDNVSLSIEAGNFVGIVGQSGSGKSTLMKLLPRLYKNDKGRIFIDDYDIEKVNLSSLRQQIGIVPQDSLLFEGTIAENIALNDPQATTESIIKSAKIACAHDFIMTLSDGYATQLSERGGNLSGGQRQRIAIARTILSNPQLLILDEATSALDYNTERQLCLNLQKWGLGKTVFFITHRLSSIRNSDQILVMDNAKLEEVGTHEALMELNGRYSTLYSQQVY